MTVAPQEFFDAYVRAALWSTNDERDESGGSPLDLNYGPEDIDGETLDKMLTDCDAFWTANEPTIRAAQQHNAETDPDKWANTETNDAGHDFWLTRNRHGAGFWDGDWPEPQATTLTDAAHAFGPIDLYVGDDGKIHG